MTDTSPKGEHKSPFEETVARAMYEHDHAPFTWEELNEPPDSGRDVYRELARVAIAALPTRGEVIEECENATLREALHNMVALARPHFSDPSQMLAIELAIRALAQAHGRKDEQARAEDTRGSPASTPSDALEAARRIVYHSSDTTGEIEDWSYEDAQLVARCLLGCFALPWAADCEKDEP